MQVGDHVRMRAGSDLGPLLGEWSEATGKVSGVFGDMDPVRINVLYGAEGPLVSTVLASEFEVDSDPAGEPF